MQLILGSASPRRKQLLKQLGLNPRVLAVEIDETPLENEPAHEYVLRMSRQKLDAVFKALECKQVEGDASLIEPGLILTSDTSVIVDGIILGKPVSQEDHRSMMKMLSGRAHLVVSSFALGKSDLSSSGRHFDTLCSETVVTEVRFKSLSDIEIEWYWNTGEPSDKAGGYGIQGIAAIFVESIQGSYSNVVGLPLMQVSEALQRHGMTLVGRQSEHGVDV